MLQVANQIEQLEQYYIFEDKAEVTAFIEQNPKVRDLLLEAPEQIKRFFPDAPIILRLRPDYDNPGKEELWIDIKTNDGNAVERYEELLENWWVEAYYLANIFNLAIGLT